MQARRGSWSNLTKVHRLGQSSPTPVCRSPRRVDHVLAPPPPLGQPFFKKAFLERKVQSWVDEIERLATFAECHPQAAYCAVTHGLVGRWTYAVRTIPETSADIKPLQNAIRSTLVPAMLSRVASNNTEWELLTLPTRLGGLGLPSLSRMAQREFEISVSVTTPLTSLVLEQKSSVGSAPELQQRVKAAALRQKNTSLQAFANSVMEHLPGQGQRAVQLACEKGSSSWLNALPLVEHGFDLTKALSVTRFPCAMVGRSRTCRQRVHMHVERILTPRTHSSAPPMASRSPARGPRSFG